MKKLKVFLKRNRLILLVALLVIAAAFSWTFFSSFGETVSDNAWDGVVADNFASGTGSENNPFVISNAAEYGYFVSLLEGEDASVYVDKNYLITNSFNYGQHDISIDNVIPFSGTINGNGIMIENANVKDYIFALLDGATIKNIKFSNVNVLIEQNTGIFAKEMNDGDISTIIVDGIAVIDEEVEDNIKFAGISFKDTGSNIENFVVNLTTENTSEYVSTFMETDGTEISNVIVRSGYTHVVNDTLSDKIIEFNVVDDEIQIDEKEIATDEYKIILGDNTFNLVKNDQNSVPNRVPNRAPLSSALIPLHATGLDSSTGTVYLNDLEADYNYYIGMDYTYFVNTGTVPDYSRLGKYNDNTLVKVYMKYSGTDINGNFTGYVSNTDNYSDFVYYKYYVVENGKVKIDLIDNPYSRRPNDKVFYGWITDYMGATVSIDMDTYTRYVEIPVNNVNETINITMYAVWGQGAIYQMSTAATIYSTNNNFTTGMQEVETTRIIKDYGNITDFSSYYIKSTIARYENFPANSYSEYLVEHTGNWNDYCRTNGGCDYYTKADRNYDPEATYYILDARTGASLLPYTSKIENLFDGSTAGLFARRTLSRNTQIDGYYDANGALQSGKCSSNNCTVYELLQYYDDNGNINQANATSTYYYLTTRDTNILVLAVSPTRERNGNGNNYYFRNTVPMTITGINNGATYNTTLALSNGYLYAQADLRIEYINITSNTVSSGNSSAASSLSNNNIFGNYYNVKIGRGFTGRSNTYGSTRYVTAGGAYAGNLSAVNTLSKYTFIIESGEYNILSATGAATSGNYNLYVNAKAIWGSDFDRASNDNSKLNIYFSTSGNWGGNLRSTTTNDIGVLQIIKSGEFGSTHNSYDCGVYAGGRGSSGTSHYVARSAIVEGGEIFNLIGGPLTATSRNNVNDTYIYVKGGSIDMVVGGAGLSTTYGNRIVTVTGGTVKYGVFGGSNGSSSTGASSQTGEIFGNSFVYIGGNAYIGGGTNTSLYGVAPGGVFGAGNGVNGYDQVGSVNNSNILINGGTIAGNVYGGGNYGATGYILSSGTTTSNIRMYAGTVNGSIYGGGNNNGSGKSNISSSINIEITGGNINTSVFGGSRTKGTTYGSTNIVISNAKIGDNVYGGGEGGYRNANNPGTYVRDNTEIVINSGEIAGSVYGGSAFGTVNAINQTTTSSTASTKVTINGGVIKNSVFGGGEGGVYEGTSYTPNIVGDITVTVNDGDISSVYGGNDQAGTHTKKNEVNLNGGVIENVYGGGNKSSVTNTNVYLNGSVVTNLYGGSNILGNVSTTNVDIKKGTVQNVYGGNNEGGTCGTTDVEVTGTATINGSIYGGGNKVNTTTTTVTLNSATGTINSVYGGGNSASVTTTNVNQNGVNVLNVFGGSNATGTVSKSNIIYNNGVSTNVFGGNNEGGNTLTSSVTIHNGTISTIYGGGNKANGDESNVFVDGGLITDIFGGGNNAGLSNSDIAIHGGKISNVYGGSNFSGKVDATKVLVDNTQTVIGNLFGGGNRAEVGTTDVKMDAGTIDYIYGGGDEAEVTGDTLVDINGGKITTDVYGGGNFGIVRGSSTVTITNATILGSAFAAGNGDTAVLEGDTSITVDGNTVIGFPGAKAPKQGSVFGGGNKASTGIANPSNAGGSTNDEEEEEEEDDSTSIYDKSTSIVNIVGGTIYGNVYGGGNTSAVNGKTIVNIGKTANNSSNLIKTNILINGHVFGGGEASTGATDNNFSWNFLSVTKGVNIIVDADTYEDLTINGSFYGGGNAARAKGKTYLSIRNYGEKNNPKRNISIQRVKYVTLDNTSILLKGAVDRANDYDKELFSISRVDSFTLQNNSELFLATGANLLMKLYSLDENGDLARVEINEDRNTLVRNVDNRVYMYEGKNLNVAEDQQVTKYGEINGMSFFGMFNYDNDGNVNTGIYNDIYNPGDILDWSGTFTRGSYVLGKHLLDHDIRVNGFYSNYINEDTAVNEVRYIEPTPADAQFYMWYIGENVIEYNVRLVASKYSTLGSVELSFLEFSKPNTSFQILNFDSTEIASGINLIDKNDIPRIAPTEDDANNNFGLSMEASNNGWLTTGKTSFYTHEPSMSGVTYYEGENSTVVPTMLFYLYHSKNITEEKELGTVRISIMSITKIDALTNEVKRLVVNVNMSSALFQTTEYEGAMTPGDKYELFTSTTNNITTKSKFSAYYALYGEQKNLYKNGYHRVLASSYVLPENTKITMLDFVHGVPEYYYYVITATDVTKAQAELNSQGEASYALSKFTRMGSKSNNSNYDDAIKNSIYYDGTSSSEEFIFIVDFSETEIVGDKLNKTLLIEIRDSNEESIISVLGIQHAQLTYNLYANMDSQINITSEPNLNPLYIGYNDIFDVSIDYQSSTLSGNTIIDTQYFDSKLGAQIYLKNNEGHLVSGTDLTGAYFEVDGVKYYPDIDGYTHIKLADKVGNTKKWIIFNTENAGLATGSYTFVFEAFASADGIYYSKGNPEYDNVPITIINSTYGLRPDIDEESIIFDKTDNHKNLKFTTQYTSFLDNPNIRIAMYRRKYDEVYDTNYELVDLQDFVSNELVTTNNLNEYLLMANPDNQNEFILPFKNELVSGTYKLSFRLYDENTQIGEIIRYIIIK